MKKEHDWSKPTEKLCVGITIERNDEFIFGGLMDITDIKDNDVKEIERRINTMKTVALRTMGKYHLIEPHRCVYCGGTEDLCKEVNCSDPKTRKTFVQNIREEMARKKINENHPEKETYGETASRYYEAMSKMTGEPYADILG